MKRRTLENIDGGAKTMTNKENMNAGRKANPNTSIEKMKDRNCKEKPTQ